MLSTPGAPSAITAVSNTLSPKGIPPWSNQSTPSAHWAFAGVTTTSRASRASQEVVRRMGFQMRSDMAVFSSMSVSARYG